MTPFSLTVPGNLLLAGEYSVLEDGGLGACLAVEPRLIVRVTPSDSWELVGRWPGGGDTWKPGKPPTFAAVVFQTLHRQFSSTEDSSRTGKPPSLAPAHIVIDSSAFYSLDGRKRGFGSSAALTVGLTAALARLAGQDPAPKHAQWAVEAHRTAQGGVGSGYDIFTSWFGGWGQFTGGAFPQWLAKNPASLPAMAVFSGPQKVSTVSSIHQYNAGKLLDPGQVQRLRTQSDEAVQRLTASHRVEAFLEAFAQCRQVGLVWGTFLDCSAEVPRPQGIDSSIVTKALGAGNELGLAVPFSRRAGSLHPELSLVRVSPEGFRWD